MNGELQKLEARARQFVRAAESAINYLQSGTLRVLLVEDSAWDVALFRQTLAKSENLYEVEDVATSQAAMTVIREHRHDLVVLDWHLGSGEHTGLEIVEQMHAEGVFFPFVVWTGVEADYREAGRKDCLAWIDKLHVTPSILNAALILAFKTHFQHQAACDPATNETDPPPAVAQAPI